MHISRFSVRNMKCFWDSGEISLGTGVNVFWGANNSGKSALLQSIRLLGNICFQPEDHRFRDFTSEEYRNKSEPDSRIEILLSIELTDTERKEVFAKFGLSADKFEKEFRSLPTLENIDFLCYDMWDKGHPGKMTVGTALSTNTEGNVIQLADLQGNPAKYYNQKVVGNQLTSTLQKQVGMHSSRIHLLPQDRFPFDMLFKIKQGIYYVSPHRIAPPSQPLQTQPLLLTDAGNLHQTLHTIYTNEPETFEMIEKFFCETFEDVRRVQTPNLEGNTTAVHLKQKHTDVGIPLSQSGTGTEQILAIATVVIGSKEPRIILIDEPHAFLHPKAEKKLVTLFEEYSQHQYIVATHSPIWINKAPWSSLHWIKKEKGKSRAQPVLTEETKELEPIFRDLGIENSDWTSVDTMIFVEGDSDEEVYRALLSKIGYCKFLTTATFASIGGIGWIRSKNKDHFFKLCSTILERLSKLPIRFFFVFDKHKEEGQLIKKLHKDYGEKVQILSRYEIENFLLEPAAIVEAMKEEAELYCEDDALRAKMISSVNLKRVKEMFENKKKDPKYYANGSLDSSTWEKSIKGSSLLDSIYEECGLLYRKRTSGSRIANHLGQEFLDTIKKELNPVFELLPQDS